MADDAETSAISTTSKAAMRANATVAAAMARMAIAVNIVGVGVVLVAAQLNNGKFVS